MLPDRVMPGVPSVERSVHPVSEMDWPVLLYSSIHSSDVLRVVPIHAISLMTTARELSARAGRADSVVAINNARETRETQCKRIGILLALHDPRNPRFFGEIL